VRKIRRLIRKMYIYRMEMLFDWWNLNINEYIYRMETLCDWNEDIINRE
jgi:hypothetical protein